MIQNHTLQVVNVTVKFVPVLQCNKSNSW